MVLNVLVFLLYWLIRLFGGFGVQTEDWSIFQILSDYYAHFGTSAFLFYEVILYSKAFKNPSKELIDGISSWWVTLHGHSNEHIANAIAYQANQLEQIIFADFTHPQAELLANRLSKLTGLEKLFFSDNGSTAVEVDL